MTAGTAERAPLGTLEEWNAWIRRTSGPIPVDPGRTLSHRMDGGPSTCHACNWRGVPDRGLDGRVSHVCPACGHEDDYRVEVGPRRVPAKVGRNQPCPCGSGRKFKRCCG